MKQVDHKKSKALAELSIRIKRADGTIVSFGTISNRPIIGPVKTWLVNTRIKLYRRKYERKQA